MLDFYIQIGGDGDDAMEVARRHGIFIVNGSECRIALLLDRASRKSLGLAPDSPLVDILTAQCCSGNRKSDPNWSSI